MAKDAGDCSGGDPARQDGRDVVGAAVLIGGVDQALCGRIDVGRTQDHLKNLFIRNRSRQTVAAQKNDVVRDRLFAPFGSSKVNGFGIGAYQARDLIRSIGGDLLVQRLQIIEHLLHVGQGLAAAYRAAHTSYLADRETIEQVTEIAGFSAGGMPDRVKCLHALAGHSLAVGPGVNPVGDRALELCAWSPSRCECAEPGAAAG